MRPDTRLAHRVTVREEQAAAALEVMSRFATAPRWLIYLPPTMSPCDTSATPGFLERPEEAFTHYRSAGLAQVVCEEKHMGSRAVLFLARDAAAAAARFRVDDGTTGSATRGPGGPSSTMMASSDRCARPSTRRACGSGWKAIGPASTARSCPGLPASCELGVRWWEALVGSGGEGMVVKPREFLVRGRRGWAQPAMKVRGPEYLRLIYGLEYTAPQNLERLHRRRLSAKRSLALREFGLGVEALERFTRGEPLHRVPECVFAVLALESEPVDPRL
jgi:hypothetical protein